MENQSQEQILEKQGENKPLRDNHGRLLPGNTANLLGRPKGKTLKDYQAEQFRLMTDEEKQKWLEDNKVSGETRWKMAEGQPKQDVDLGGEVISKVVKLDE